MKKNAKTTKNISKQNKTKIYIIIVLSIIAIIEITIFTVQGELSIENHVAVLTEEEYRALLKEELTYELITKPEEEQKKLEEEQQKQQELQQQQEQEQLQQEQEQELEPDLEVQDTFEVPAGPEQT